MTKEDLSLKWYFVKKNPNVCDDPAKAFNAQLKLKSEIRRYYKQQSKQDPVTCIFDNGDSYTLLIKLPEYINTEKSAEYYFKNNYYRECVPSQYDCTGQHYTSWYKIVKRSYGFVVFHHVSVDW